MCLDRITKVYSDWGDGGKGCSPTMDEIGVENCPVLRHLRRLQALHASTSWMLDSVC
jgi:hypothetical protein